MDYHGSIDRSNSEYAARMMDNNKTLVYRQKILQLAANRSFTQIGWLVSQHFLDRLWTSQQQWQYQDNIPKPSRTKTTNDNNHIKIQEATSPSCDAITLPNKILYACQQCGCVIHPGWRGSHLRVKTWRTTKSTNTRTSTASRKTVRRREQRARRKQNAIAATTATTREKQHQHRPIPGVSYEHMKNTGSLPLATLTVSKSSNSGSDSACKEAATPQLILLLGDDDDVYDNNNLRRSSRKNATTRNYFLMTCGRCHGKIVLKGVKKQSQQQQQENVTINPKKHLPKSLTTVGCSSAVANSFDVEYLALPPIESKRKRSLLESGPPRDSDALIAGHLAGLTGKKKKRKGLQQMNSKLANFLSSLNDP